jgi:hypothetical protein
MEHNSSNIDSQKTPEHVLRYMPSKKIQIIIGVILIITILYAFKNPIIGLYNNVFNKNADIPTPTLVGSVVEQELKPLSVDVDTDGDGLADWQETLLGTDPLVANSKADVPDSIRELVGTTSNNLITTEDKIALKVYQRLQTDPKGDNIVQAIQAATTKEVLDLADSMDKQLTTYTFDDLNIVDETPTSVEVYKNAITAFNKTLVTDDAVARDIYNGIINNEKTIGMSVFQVSLTSSVGKLLAMPVPLKSTSEHLTLVNAMAHASEILATTTQLNKNETSIIYATLLVFQKNVNLVRETVDIIIKIL